MNSQFPMSRIGLNSQILFPCRSSVPLFIHAMHASRRDRELILKGIIEEGKATRQSQPSNIINTCPTLCPSHVIVVTIIFRQMASSLGSWRRWIPITSFHFHRERLPVRLLRPQRIFVVRITGDNCCRGCGCIRRFNPFILHFETNAENTRARWYYSCKQSGRGQYRDRKRQQQAIRGGSHQENNVEKNNNYSDLVILLARVRGINPVLANESWASHSKVRRDEQNRAILYRRHNADTVRVPLVGGNTRPILPERD